MRGQLTYTGFSLGIKTARCSNHCRYCLAGEKKYDTLSFSRFEALVESFIQWRKENCSHDFQLSYSFFYSYEIGLKRQIRQWALGDRLGLSGRTLLMNGLMIRPEDEMRDWLQERKEAGANRIHSAFYGTRELQDKTHGRRGDHDFLLMANRTAADLGMQRYERLFLTKDTISHLERLIETLDEIPNLKNRWIQVLGYSGWARRMEDLRCTRADLETLPSHVSRYLNADGLVTEGEFISQVRNGYSLPTAKGLGIWVDDSNIAVLESKPCGQIVAEEEEKWNRLYSLAPEPRELCERYGNPQNIGLSGPGSILAIWRERYLSDHPKLIAPAEEQDFIHL
jgi:hypothetical protein